MMINMVINISNMMINKMSWEKTPMMISGRASRVSGPKLP